MIHVQSPQLLLLFSLFSGIFFFVSFNPPLQQYECSPNIAAAAADHNHHHCFRTHGPWVRKRWRGGDRDDGNIRTILTQREQRAKVHSDVPDHRANGPSGRSGGKNRGASHKGFIFSMKQPNMGEEARGGGKDCNEVIFFLLS